MTRTDWRQAIGFIDGIAEDLDRNPSLADALADAVTRSDLIEELLEARRAEGLTQGDVAGHMGTSQSAVSELENRQTDPHLSTLQRYARAVSRSLTVQVSMRETPSRVGGWQYRPAAHPRSKVIARAPHPAKDRWAPIQSEYQRVAS